MLVVYLVMCSVTTNTIGFRLSGGLYSNCTYTTNSSCVLVNLGFYLGVTCTLNFVKYGNPLTFVTQNSNMDNIAFVSVANGALPTIDIVHSYRVKIVAHPHDVFAVGDLELTVSDGKIAPAFSPLTSATFKATSPCDAISMTVTPGSCGNQCDIQLNGILNIAHCNVLFSQCE